MIPKDETRDHDAILREELDAAKAEGDHAQAAVIHHLLEHRGDEKSLR